MIRRSARQTLSRLWWRFRNKVHRVTWNFFAWHRQPQMPPLTEGRIVLAGKGDEPIGERMAVLRGASVDQYRGWLDAGHWVLYAAGPDDDIQSWIWFTFADGGPQIAPFDFGLGMKVPAGVGFLWDAFTARLSPTGLIQDAAAGGGRGMLPTRRYAGLGPRQRHQRVAQGHPDHRFGRSDDNKGNSYRTDVPDIHARLSSHDVGARRVGNGSAPSIPAKGNELVSWHHVHPWQSSVRAS